MTLTWDQAIEVLNWSSKPSVLNFLCSFQISEQSFTIIASYNFNRTMFHAVGCSSKMAQKITPTMASELQIPECHWNTISALFSENCTFYGRRWRHLFSCLLNDTVQWVVHSYRWNCLDTWIAPQGFHPDGLELGLVLRSRCHCPYRRCLCWPRWCCCSARKEKNVKRPNKVNHIIASRVAWFINITEVK